LEAVLLYCEAAVNFAQELEKTTMKSRGFLAFREYVANYVHSQTFQALQKEAQKVKHGLSNVKYSVIIQEGRFSVRKYEGETDYSVEVLQTFEKFKQGAAKNYLSDLGKGSGMNHIEGKILEFVALLYPKPFAALDQFCAAHSQFVDETIRVFDREVQFYVAYLEFITDIKYKGLKFCYPQVGESREVYDYDGFDLALGACADLHQQIRSSAMIFRSTVPNGSSSSRVRTRAARPPLRARLVSYIILPVSAVRCRGGKRGSFCSTRSSRTSSGRRISATCAANWRMMWRASMTFSPVPHRTAS
jgi:hypothetical protein